jgi:predicted CopG family antitoxin
MPTAVVRIGERARQTLKEMSEREGKSMGAVIEELIERDRRAKFYQAVDAAYEALWADPEAAREELEERREAEATVADDLEDDPWEE